MMHIHLQYKQNTMAKLSKITTVPTSERYLMYPRPLWPLTPLGTSVLGPLSRDNCTLGASPVGTASMNWQMVKHAILLSLGLESWATKHTVDAVRCTACEGTAGCCSWTNLSASQCLSGCWRRCDVRCGWWERTLSADLPNSCTIRHRSSAHRSLLTVHYGTVFDSD